MFWYLFNSSWLNLLDGSTLQQGADMVQNMFPSGGQDILVMKNKHLLLGTLSLDVVCFFTSRWSRVHQEGYKKKHWKLLF
jgi:hypothetical protein